MMPTLRHGRRPHEEGEAQEGAGAADPEGLPRRDAVPQHPGAADAIEFYKKALGAAEVMRMPGPEGKLGHAEIRIGGSRVMLSDEYPEMDFLGPQTRGGTSVHLHVYVRDVDAVVERAVAAGAKLLRPVEDKFYGDRTGTLQDPFGHVWHVSTHVEDVPPKEMKKRAAEIAAKAQS
jgi:PhnB protein